MDKFGQEMQVRSVNSENLFQQVMNMNGESLTVYTESTVQWQLHIVYVYDI